MTRQTLTSCLAGLPGTQPAPAPPPAACLGLMFPAQTPRWLVAATAPARPLGSCRHGGLLPAEAYFSPRWLQTHLAREESPEVKPQWEVWHPKNEAKGNPAVRSQESKAFFTLGLGKTWEPANLFPPVKRNKIRTRRRKKEKKNAPPHS